MKKMKHDAAELRKQRLSEIAKTIAKGVSKGVDYEKLVNQIEYTYGLRRPTVERDLAVIMTFQDWVVKSGSIVVAE
jgi:hypothetical protein